MKKKFNLSISVEIIEIFGWMANFYKWVGDTYRESAYINAIDVISRTRSNEGMGDRLKEKTLIIEKKGYLPEQEHLVAVSDLKFLPGFGAKQIYKLAKLLKTKKLKDIMKESKFTTMQLKSLKYRNKLTREIHFSKAVKVAKEIVKQIKSKKVDIVGSIRRKKEFVKDIDILIVGGPIDVTKLSGYVDTLTKGDKKTSFLYKVNKSKIIQVDVRYSSVEDYPFQLMHFTGSKNFNIMLRSRAKEMGYKLNEYGLWDLITGKEIKNIKTELDILNILNTSKEFKDPSNRKYECCVNY